MLSFKEAIFIFALGGVIYSLIEVVFRGFTHWTMTIAGGLAFLLLYIINIRLGASNIILKCIIGCLAITLIEFIVGMIVNKRFGLNVWDYSSRKFNLYGQICPLFTGVWFLLCFPGVSLCELIKNRI